MASLYPNALDSFPDPAPNSKLNNPSHSGLHNDVSSAVEALEEKVGVNNSADPASLDYRVTALENAPPAESLYPATVLSQLGIVSIYDRMQTAGTASLTTQLPFLTGFIAPKSMTVSNLSVYLVTGTGTATSAYLALYSLAANGDATRVATSANTTSLFSSTGLRTAAMTSPAAIVGGNAYAVYIHYVGSFTPQLMSGPITNPSFAHHHKQPYYGVLRGSSTTAAPPASLAYSTGTAINTGAFYAELS